MKSLLFFLTIIGFSASAFAEETSRIELKHKSSFALSVTDRNPFWPIGWKPSPKIAADKAGPAIPSSAFVVSSITLGNNQRFAIINGKAMAEGQQFGLQLGGAIHEITVKTIEDGRVILLRRDQEIVVPLRRK